MNLDEMISDEGAVLELNDPDGKPLYYDGKRVTITLDGTNSERFQKAKYKIGNKRLKSNPNPAAYKSLSDADDDEAELLAAITLSWENVAFENGIKECTFENAKRLYLNPKTEWVKRQVNEFAGDVKNFMTASSSS